jgi:hypothetical protein
MSRFTRRFGHRAAFVWLISAAWIVMGLIVAAGDFPPQDHLFHTYLPVPLRAMLWIIPAVLAATVARSSHEWMAFPLLGLPAAQRLVSFWVGALYSSTPDHPPWIAWDLLGRGFVYLVILLLMWLVATWPNPIEISTDYGDEDEGEEDAE